MSADLFSWADSSTARLQLTYLLSSGTWEMLAVNGANTATAQANPTIHNAGALLTVIGSWNAATGTVSVSVNGSTQSSATTASSVPTLAATLFDLASGGSVSSGHFADGDVLWAATGTGTLTSSDAAAINGLGNHDPGTGSFPSGDDTTAVWDGVSPGLATPSQTTDTTSYSYDAADELTSQTSPSGQSYGYSYDSRGNLQGIQYPNGSYGLTETDPDGWVSAVCNDVGTLPGSPPSNGTCPSGAKPISEDTYTYNEDGQKVEDDNVTGPGAVTSSSNEITDSERTAGVQGDGFASPDSSTGIWEPTTNLETNGSFETNLANAGATTGTNTVTRSNTQAKFGSYSLKVVDAGTSDSEGVEINASGLTPSAPYSVSFWIYSSSATQLYLTYQEYDSSGGFLRNNGPSSGSVISLAGTGWQYFNLPTTAGTGTTQVGLLFDNFSLGATAKTYYIDGLQVESTALGTPFVDTDGNTAARLAPRVQASASVLAHTSGWVALRFRAGFAHNVDKPNNNNDPDLFTWADSSTSRLQMSYSLSAHKWKMAAQNGATTATAQSATSSHTAGAILTLIGTWNASTGTVTFSVNGGNFTTATTSGSVPTLAATLFDLGGGGTVFPGHYADGDILWAATGTGALTNANASTINGFGNSDPSVGSFPGGGDTTAVWDGTTAPLAIPTPTTSTTTYTYDNLGRLETASLPSATTDRYCYDLDSNRTKIISPSSGTCSSGTAISTYTYTTGTDTPEDALTAQTGPTHSYTYDGGGSSLGDGMIIARGSDSYSWDGSGRLEDSTVASKSACYTYSPDGSLKTRIYDSGGNPTCSSPTTTMKYLLGDLYETDASGNITASYDDGPLGDLASYTGAPSSGSPADYLYYDGHGNLSAETTNGASTTAIHTYDPFGVPLDNLPANSTSHRYTGRWDKQDDSTTGLILMGARPYDPSLGRFYAVDPVDGGSLNNYDYAGQDPIHNYDLTGKSFWSCAKHPVRCAKGKLKKVKNAIGQRYCNAISHAYGGADCPPVDGSSNTNRSTSTPGCSNGYRFVYLTGAVAFAYFAVTGALELASAEAVGAAAASSAMEQYTAAVGQILRAGSIAMKLGGGSWISSLSAYEAVSC